MGWNFFKSTDIQVQPKSFSNVSGKFNLPGNTPVARIRNSPDWSPKLNSGDIPPQNAKMIDGLADLFPDMTMDELDALYDADGFLKSPSWFNNSRRTNQMLAKAQSVQKQGENISFKQIRTDAEAKLKIQNDAKASGKEFDINKIEELLDAKIKNNNTIIQKADDVFDSSKKAELANANWVSACTSKPLRCTAYAIVAVIAAYILIKKIKELVEAYEDYKADMKQWKKCMNSCLISEDTGEEDPMIVPEPSNSSDTKYALLQESIENFSEPLQIDLSPAELNLLIKNLTNEYFDVQLFLDDFNKDQEIQDLDINNDDNIDELIDTLTLHEEMTETLDDNFLLKPIEELGTTVGLLLSKIKFNNTSITNTNGTSYNITDNKQIVIEVIIYAGLIITTNSTPGHNEENFQDSDVTDSLFGRMCVTGKDNFGHNTHFDNYKDDGHPDASCKKYCKTKSVCGNEPDNPLHDPGNYIPDELNPAKWFDAISDWIGGGPVGKFFSTLLMIIGALFILFICYKLYKVVSPKRSNAYKVPNNYQGPP